MKEFELLIERGHPILRLEEGLALIDTGAPQSIGLGGSFHMLGSDWNPSSGMSSVLELVEQQLGHRVDWLLGHDFIKEFRIYLDYSRGVAGLSREEIELPGGVAADLEFLMGVPLLTIEYSNQLIKSILDTGAALSYASADAVDGMQPIRKQTDFYPMFGEFETEVWSLPIRVCGTDMQIEAGVLPDMLGLMVGMMSDGWILGSDLFNTGQVVLDYTAKRVVIARGRESESAIRP